MAQESSLTCASILNPVALARCANTYIQHLCCILLDWYLGWTACLDFDTFLYSFLIPRHNPFGSHEHGAHGSVVQLCHPHTP